jgi:hypothetical protein
MAPANRFANLIIVLFCSFIAISFGAIYCFSRIGFSSLHYREVMVTIGTCLLLLNVSAFPSVRITSPIKWTLSPSFLLLILLFFVTTLGAIAIPEILTFSMYFFLVGGIGLFLHTIAVSLSHLRIIHLIAIAAFSFVFSFGLAGLYWGIGIMSPLYLESFAIQLPHIDSLFHLAIAQMIKTYGVVSVGIEGPTYFPYHFGSHFLLLQFSNLLSIDLTIAYQIVFPIIFLPLAPIASAYDRDSFCRFFRCRKI